MTLIQIYYKDSYLKKIYVHQYKHEGCYNHVLLIVCLFGSTCCACVITV